MLDEQFDASSPAESRVGKCNKEVYCRNPLAAGVLTGGSGDDSVRWKPRERFHHLFEERVDALGSNGSKEARDATAVEYADEQFTFADLEDLSNRLAHYLIRQGASPGDRIALLFDRSIYAYASVLAVSKAGCVFVPLDPGFPPNRIAFIAKDSGVSMVATLSIYSAFFSELDLPILALDAVNEEFEKLPATRLPNANSKGVGDALSYVIYTSGTTGQPKGVQIRHSSICNFLRIAVQEYGYRDDDRVYQSLTMAFDYSFEEIWVPLLCGAQLVPAPSGVSLLGSDLTDFLASNRISAFCCVPTVLATIDAELPDLRLLITSGEACPRDLVARWWKPERRFLNLYGPTETTVTATWSVLTKDGGVTIGGPLPTYSVMVLSPDKPELLAPGETGEVAIAGIGLSPGYLNREKETKKAFVEDFIGIENNPSGKLYRTGDLGRINGSNELEYSGRLDTQVKIRGYRIELGEIETVAREATKLSAFIVNPVELEPGTLELTAYYAESEGVDTPDPVEIHSALKDRLPPYMVPAFFEKLDGLPLLPSGKVDRSKLPLPSSARLTTTGKSFVEPKEGTEQDLAELLASLLKVERISADADFFDDLGANSLVMARYLGSVRKKLGLKSVSMKRIYQHPTVAQLAQSVAADAEAKQALVTKEATSEAGRTPFPQSVTQMKPSVELPPADAIERKREANLTLDVPLVAKADDQVPAPSPKNVEWHVASDVQYYLCGVLQFAYMGFIAVVFSFAFVAAFRWIDASNSLLEIYLRSVASGMSIFVGTSALLILVKWLAVGRFTTGKIPIWRLSYVCFWIAQTSIRANPLNIFVGTPLYNVFLRLLGAKIGPGAVIFARAPICADLVSVGEYSVIRQDCQFSGYRAHAGYLELGPIAVGSHAFVAEATVLEINTQVGNDAQLGTTSALLENQSVPDGTICQGTPTEETVTDFVRVPPLEISLWRGRLYALGQFAYRSVFSFPVPITAGYLFIEYGLSGSSSSAATAAFSVGLTGLLLYSVALYFGGIFLALIGVMTLPKLLNIFFVPDKPHKIFGFQYFLARSLETSSHSTLLQSLFGDSSMIMPYFRAVGYDLKNATQNGSNFGVEQRHNSPFLCQFNRNTLVSDGLVMLNMDISSSSFKMSGISVPPDAYLGNNVHYPVGGKVGENCLIATKAMIPIDGAVRENVGILGSPPFEIPRSVEPNARLMHYKQPGVFEQRLWMKLKSNLLTLALFMVRNCSALFLVMAASYWTYSTFTDAIVGSTISAAAVFGLLSMFSTVFVTLYYMAFEWAANYHRPMKPRICSLYERPFWDHERFWKMNINGFLAMFDGTPMKNLILRLQGVKLGAKVFDNGASISEPYMVEIGDHTCLNIRSSVQGHSLEDGTFKSDAISIGARCTIGVQGFVHYGAVVGDDVIIEADAFVMKGSVVSDGEVWSGNPAKLIHLRDEGGANLEERRTQ